MKEYIQRLKEKPEHVRKQIALGTSVGVTALVGVIWFTTMVTTNSFALNANNPEAGQPKEAAVAITNTNVKSSFAELLGAVGAAATGSSTKPSITIVDGNAASSLDAKPTNNASATVIPF